ncbi:heavy-metal-associated domain-containing protein [Arthrobacter sp. GN70]|uniref:Copper chaperone n=2 Tax=Arthrobacter TaxID=1663 RepID=A0A4R5KIM1_9MICC|nr:heavy-metal-associated domain-containing protein [Arthrobacter sp. GN70]TDF94277.1 copper chaperone [Arthrobacter terricola]
MPSGACCGNPASNHHPTIQLTTKEHTMGRTATIQTNVSVSGMTCGHCISAVSEEIESLAGVELVEVDLNPGGLSSVTITSTQELSPAEIGEAVAEAGYLVVANEA